MGRRLLQATSGLCGCLAVLGLLLAPAGPASASASSSASASIVTVAGNGIAGYSGNGGPATQAKLDQPFATAISSSNGLLIADYASCVVQEVSLASDTITTVAGDGTCGNSGMGGLATAASIGNPGGLATYGNALYISDPNACTVLEVDSAGTITTVAGDGTCGYSGDGGPATSAELDQPRGLAVSSAGDLYIADTSNCVIREVDSAGTITTVAGDGTCGYSGDGGPATSAELLGPTGLAMGPGGQLYIADTSNCVIREVDSAGTITTVAGDGTCGYSGDGGPATSAELNDPAGLSVSSDGDVFLADTGNNVVQEFGAVPLQPVVSAVTPAAGTASGGSSVTITGLNFSQATQVMFGSSPAASFVVVSDFEITAVSPPSPSGDSRVAITVTTPVGTSSASPDAGYLYVVPGPYNPVTPYRIADTRQGSSKPYAGDTLGPNGTLSIQVAGVGGVPSSGVSAVVMNVTVTNTTAAGYLTVWPAGLSRPTASNLNWLPGETVANLVEVALGQGGQVEVFNSSGSTDVVVDLEGWVGATSTGAGLFEPLVPARICDTRPANPSGLSGPAAQCNGVGDSGGTIGPGKTLSIQVAGVGGVPSSGVSAVVMNVTVTNTTAAGYLTVWPAGVSRPTASNLNWLPGETVANRVMVGLGANGQVSLFNYTGLTNVIVDVNGWFTDPSSSSTAGSLYNPTEPTRIADTRAGSGEPYAGQMLGPRGILSIEVTGVGGVPSTGVKAVVMNVTVTDTTSAGYLTVWPSETAQPEASDINWGPNQTVPNLVVVEVGSNGEISAFNSAGNTDLVVDIVGWYS
ncbi:MAG: IPT/TIG domain-containing protein [Actinobacteria bacterium]|nr:IPT/TIG domain-containing protein [Actinomycetota bacterium]